MTKIKNLTPHEVTIIGPGMSPATWGPCENPPRVEMHREQIGTVYREFAWSSPNEPRMFAPDGTSRPVREERGGMSLPVFRTEPGEVVGLPEPEDGTFYIVSRVIAEACRERGDLLIPDDAVRNAAGQIVACKALAVIGEANEMPAPVPPSGKQK